jgi:DtxR family Mn-dependent transcriptional regulator
LPPEQWHRAAHRAEHRFDQAAADRLADRLNNPRFDPHGDPIPTREGELPVQARTALPEWPDGRDALIEHLEDEPEAIYRQIGKLGLHPGMVLTKPFHQADGAVICRAEGRTLFLAPELVALIHVAEVPADNDLDSSVGRLVDLAPGAEAVIHSLSPACTGAERRRLLDLGLVPGTNIRCEFTSPFGSPRAYFLRGTLVALRREQADRILVRTAPPATA